MKYMILVSLIFVLEAVGCKKAEVIRNAHVFSSTEPISEVVNLTDVLSGSTVKVQKGGTIKINLVEDPSHSPIKWILSEGDLYVVKRFNDDGETKQTIDNSQEIRKFNLRVLGSGTLTFKLLNPYEKSSIIKIVTFNIVIF